MKFEEKYIHNRNEWHSDNYQIVEMVYKHVGDLKQYHCFKKSKFGFNFIVKQPALLTPECAIRFCENDAGEL